MGLLTETTAALTVAIERLQAACPADPALQSLQDWRNKAQAVLDASAARKAERIAAQMENTDATGEEDGDC